MTFAELKERLENGEGPDRDIDRALSDMFGTKNDFGVPICAGYLGIADFTSSIDAAVRLCRHVLPGWGWRVATCCVSDDAWVFPDFNSPEHGERLKLEFSEAQDWSELTDVDLRPPGRPAIALCIAILNAKQAIEDLR